MFVKSGYFSFFYFLWVGFLFFSFSKSLHAQQPAKIEIINANSAEYDEAARGKMKRLLGNVIFRQDSAYLYCDSAYFYSEQNNLEAFSHVHIKQGDSVNVYGDLLKYFGNTKKAQLFESIRMTDGKMTLTTDRMDYDMSTNIAFYNDSGKIVDKEDTLTSKIGYYYSNDKEFFFKKNVVLVNPEYIMKSDILKYNSLTKTAFFFGPSTITGKDMFIYCENGWYDTENDLSRFSRNAYIISKEHKLRGDSLIYDKKNGFSEAFANITITDTVQHIIINGDYGKYHQSNESSLVTGHAIMTEIFSPDSAGEAPDSMFLHADTLMAMPDTMGWKNTVSDSLANQPAGKKIEMRNDSISARNDSLPINRISISDTAKKEKPRLLLAFHHVKIFKSDLQGKCDSLAYSGRDSLIHMYGEPVVWSKENQLSAEFINMQLKNQQIETLHLINSSFIVSRQDSSRFNQIKGKSVTGYFKDSHLYKIFVEGNGQTIYYGKDKNEKFMGVNRADCSDMLILIKDNKVERITLINAPEATFYPMGELSAQELLLKGFSWQDHERPYGKEDIFLWGSPAPVPVEEMKKNE